MFCLCFVYRFRNQCSLFFRVMGIAIIYVHDNHAVLEVIRYKGK